MGKSRSGDFYSYIFQEEEDITAAYFTTRSETGYRVYFYPIVAHFEHFQEGNLINKTGYFFGFTKLSPNEEKIEPIDLKVRNTILHIVSEFYNQKGNDIVLLFSCDDGDGKNKKRADCFQYWFISGEWEKIFLKFDEEIIVSDKDGTNQESHFLSLIINRKNAALEDIMAEFQLFKEKLIAGK